MIDDTYNEKGYIRRMLEQLNHSQMVAIVIDTYDMYNFLRVFGSMKDEVLRKTAGGKTVVVRPDSGDPTMVPVQVIKILMEEYGYTTNDKGYKTLPPCIRVIQGDGINKESIKQILENLEKEKMTLDNIAFGMGGALLQHQNRDTLKFAMKANAAVVDGVSRDVFKDPITDQGKKSFAGILKVVEEDGEIVTKRADGPNLGLLQTVFVNGRVVKIQTFDDVRARSNQ